MKEQKMNSGYNNWLYGGFVSAFFYLLLVAILGVSMRSSPWFTLPFSYQNILHSHSHTALLGWAFVMSLGGLTFYNQFPWKWFKPLNLLLGLSVIGMFATFIYQGYAVGSIAFSTLFLILAYIFLKKLLGVIPKLGFDNIMLRRGIIYFYFSTLGIWVLGPTSVVLGKSHWLYEIGIQFFLHFQINGWLLYVVLGLIYKKIPKAYYPKDWVPHFLDTGLVLGTALLAFWVTENSIFYTLNIISAICLAIGLIPIIQSIIRYIRKTQPNQAIVLSLVVFGLIGKILAHAFSLDYGFILNLRYNRELVIAYIHLILIGIVSIGLIWNVLQIYSLNQAKTFRTGLTGFMVGFYITEILLTLQGFRLFAYPYAAFILWMFSVVMLIGIILMLYSFLFVEMKKETQIF